MYMSARMEKLLDELRKLGGTGLLLDVGCDHAYVAIEAVRRGLAEKAIASDINSGPLISAGQHIEAVGLSDSISTVLSDGLRDIGEELLVAEARGVTLLAAGMGGRLIRDILKEAGSKLSHIDKLVLSPQSEPELVRGFIMDEAGFAIKDEAWIEDEGKTYVVIAAEAGTETEPYGSHELLFGRQGLKRSDPVLGSYLLRLEEDTKEALKNAKRGSSDKARARSQELSRLSEEIKRALSCFDASINGGGQ